MRIFEVLLALSHSLPARVVSLALVIAVSSCAQQPTGVAAAAEALGAANLNSIEYQAVDPRSRSARRQVPEGDGRGSRRKPMPWPSTTRHRRCGLSSYARRVSTHRAAAAVSRSPEINERFKS